VKREKSSCEDSKCVLEICLEKGTVEREIRQCGRLQQKMQEVHFWFLMMHTCKKRKKTLSSFLRIKGIRRDFHLLCFLRREFPGKYLI